MEPKSPHFWGWWAEVQTHHHWILLNPSLHEWTHLSRHKIFFVGLCIFASLAISIMCHVYNGLKGKKIKPGKKGNFHFLQILPPIILCCPFVCVFSSPLLKEWWHLLQQTDWTSQPTLCIRHRTPRAAALPLPPHFLEGDSRLQPLGSPSLRSACHDRQ